MFWFRKQSLFERKREHKDIAPDEIFLDASNLPNFDTYQFEGRLERPVSNRALVAVSVFFVLVIIITAGRLWELQVVKGDLYFEVSEENRLDHEIIFARRGVIVDRKGVPIAWNESIPQTEESVLGVSTSTESRQAPPVVRRYYDELGFAHILGYVSYPKKDTQGFYFQEEIIGQDGVELFYDALLAGENGRRLTETNALGEQLSKTSVYQPTDGDRLNLSIDASIQTELYKYISALAEDVGFIGGGAVILDITNGEVLALTSAPEYDLNVITDGEDTETIEQYFNDPAKPFLNRVIGGLYTPGSIIKPFIALGALGNNLIDPATEIFSSGELVVPNPFDSSRPTIFKDWKAHGWVDMRTALAVSSKACSIPSPTSSAAASIASASE